MNEWSTLLKVDAQMLKEIGIMLSAFMAIVAVLGTICFLALKRQQKQIARLGRFCENPACVFHNRAVTKKGCVKIDGRDIFTRVLQTQSGKELRFCDRCKSAIETWKSS